MVESRNRTNYAHPVDLGETLRSIQDHQHSLTVHVEELLQRVRSSDSGIGSPTIYRTLKLLVEAGLAGAGSSSPPAALALRTASQKPVTWKMRFSIVETGGDQEGALRKVEPSQMCTPLA